MCITENQTRDILAILAAGGTRYCAARIIGIKPNILIKEILKNPDLSERVSQAEQQAQLFFLTQLREATKKGGGWRAAAWWLERRQNETYGNKKAEQITSSNIQVFMGQLFEVLTKHITDTDTIKKIVDETLLLLPNAT